MRGAVLHAEQRAMQGNGKGSSQAEPGHGAVAAGAHAGDLFHSELKATIATMAGRVERLAAQVPAQRLLSKRQAAALLGISRGRTLDRLIQSGAIRTVQVGTRARIPMAELERIQIEGAPSSTASSRVVPRPRAPRLPATRPPNLERELAKARALKVSDL